MYGDLLIWYNILIWFYCGLMEMSTLVLGSYDDASYMIFIVINCNCKYIQDYEWFICLFT